MDNEELTYARIYAEELARAEGDFWERHQTAGQRTTCRMAGIDPDNPDIPEGLAEAMDCGLDLRDMNPLHYPRLDAALKEGDPGMILTMLDSHNEWRHFVQSLWYYIDIWPDQVARLCLEAWHASSMSNAVTTAKVDRAIFREIGRDRLLAEAPLPGMPDALYRGISGTVRKRRGCSWTSDRDMALWFARRYSMADPVLLTINHPSADWLYGYINSRAEHEYIVVLPRLTTIQEEPA